MNIRLMLWDCESILKAYSTKTGLDDEDRRVLRKIFNAYPHLKDHWKYLLKHLVNGREECR